MIAARKQNCERSVLGIGENSIKMPPKTKTITKNYRKVGEENLLKKEIQIKSRMTKLIQAMIIHFPKDKISCLDERYIIIPVNLHIQKSLGLVVFSGVDCVA